MDKIWEEKDLSVKTFKKKTWFHYDTIIKAYNNGYIGRTVIKFLKKMKIDIDAVASKPLLQANDEDIKEQRKKKKYSLAFWNEIDYNGSVKKLRQQDSLSI